ncbi:MAG: branched-chain amino acid ABC transporter permease [Gaiellaceae bacterium]
MRRAAGAVVALVGPLALVALAGWIGAGLSASRQLEFGNALVNTAIVVALYVFIGNSGVISFGHVSFVAVGAYLSGILTLGATEKNFVLPALYPWLRHTQVATVTSLALATAIGGIYALVVGLPLMRLSGLPAGIATFAVLGITYNVLRNWEKIGPAAQALTSVPEVSVWTLAVGALVAIVVAFVYQRSRGGRMLRATREDPGAAQAAGINVYRQRLVAFTISGALAGFAGGLLMHELGTITTDQVYLELTFLTLAMLVVGGVNSLFGAVVGALLISALDSFLGDAENGIRLGIRINLPDGTRLVVLGALMALVLLLRPSGITGGRELGLGFPRRARI